MPLVRQVLWHHSVHDRDTRPPPQYHVQREKTGRRMSDDSSGNGRRFQVMASHRTPAGQPLDRAGHIDIHQPSISGYPTIRPQMMSGLPLHFRRREAEKEHKNSGGGDQEEEACSCQSIALGLHGHCGGSDTRQRLTKDETRRRIGSRSGLCSAIRSREKEKSRNVKVARLSQHVRGPGSKSEDHQPTFDLVGSGGRDITTALAGRVVVAWRRLAWPPAASQLLSGPPHTVRSSTEHVPPPPSAATTATLSPDLSTTTWQLRRLPPLSLAPPPLLLPVLLNCTTHSFPRHSATASASIHTLLTGPPSVALPAVL
nr:hypothetical protein CFP56_01108 [Quercus suber]